MRYRRDGRRRATPTAAAGCGSGDRRDGRRRATPTAAAGCGSGDRGGGSGGRLIGHRRRRMIGIVLDRRKGRWWRTPAAIGGDGARTVVQDNRSDSISGRNPVSPCNGRTGPLNRLTTGRVRAHVIRVSIGRDQLVPVRVSWGRAALLHNLVPGRRRWVRRVLRANLVPKLRRRALLLSVSISVAVILGRSA